MVHTWISSSNTTIDINCARDVTAARQTAEANNALCKCGLEIGSKEKVFLM